MSTMLSELVELILRELVTDGMRPPQIVPVPDDAEDFCPVTVILPQRTIAHIDTLASVYGTSRENIVRIILNATSAVLGNTSADFD